MNKKIIINTFLLLYMPIISSNDNYIETTHTFWVPWTTEHSLLWENIESKDTSISHFRRNEYFEDIPTLLQRDSHWIHFSNLIQSKYNATFIFPPLGFAIFDKTNDELIGTIRFSFSQKKGFLSLGYGLSQAARHKKLGSEIVEKVTALTDYYRKLPMITLKSEVPKSMFMYEWHKQGKKRIPNFNKLINLLNNTPQEFYGINASVDAKNYGSLSILNRNMQPLEIECSQLFLKNNTNFFCYDFQFTYPMTQETTYPNITSLITNILSRDTSLIMNAENDLKKLFNIPDNNNWTYLGLTRDEKSQLHSDLLGKSITLFSTINSTKKTSSTYYPKQYCLVP